MNFWPVNYQRCFVRKFHPIRSVGFARPRIIACPSVRICESLGIGYYDVSPIVFLILPGAESWRNFSLYPKVEKRDFIRKGRRTGNARNRCNGTENNDMITTSGQCGMFRAVVLWFNYVYVAVNVETVTSKFIRVYNFTGIRVLRNW